MNLEIGRKMMKKLREHASKIEEDSKFIGSIYACSICAYNYDNRTRIPICLPCGHTICKICLESLKQNLLTGCCPFDRKDFFFIDELLPVNYSLLALHEGNSQKLCQIHGMQIIGYCNEHCELLCGKCIFSHQNHDFFDIDSLQTEKIIENKWKDLETYEILLNNMKAT